MMMEIQSGMGRKKTAKKQGLRESKFLWAAKENSLLTPPLLRIRTVVPTTGAMLSQTERRSRAWEGPGDVGQRRECEVVGDRGTGAEDGMGNECHSRVVNVSWDKISRFLLVQPQERITTSYFKDRKSVV